MLKIKDYDKLNEYMTAFSQKGLNLMIVVSRGGLGKTFLAEEALIKEAPLIFNGHVTPLSMYRELYKRNEEEKDFIVIFDDVDSLAMNKTNIAILKQLCDTREEKTIKYNSSSRAIRDIGSEFTTKCKVLMLMNDIKTTDKNFNALLTRSHLIEFNPTDTEITKQIKKFGTDKEIIKFIESYAHFSKTLNIRVYKRALELKNSGLGWKEAVINELNIDERLFEIEKLLKKYKTDKEREEHFSDSRSNFYRYKKLFLAKNQ